MRPALRLARDAHSTPERAGALRPPHRAVARSPSRVPPSAWTTSALQRRRTAAEPSVGLDSCSTSREAGRRADGRTHPASHVLSHLAMQGAPGKAIQALAGHQEMSVTQGYMHLSPDVLGSSIQLLDTRPRLVKRGDIVETASAQNGS
jgi:hypothetical protein